LLSIVLAGVIFGFLRYNFNPASIFLGDSGSLFIGFLLSALALEGSQKASTVVAVAIPVVSFGLPLVDVGLSVLRRFMNSKPLFLGDDDHVHHKLIKRGFSHRDAVLVLYAVAAAFGILSLTLLHGDTMIGVVLLLVGLGVWLGVQQLKYVELYELGAAARQLWRRKRITRNNLHIRRAMETWATAKPDFAELCHVLRASLESAGFCGIAISFVRADWIDESLMLPLRPDDAGRCTYLWAQQDLLPPQWELNLELSSPGGASLGTLSLFRERAADPLLVDINLLGAEFRAAIAGLLESAIEKIPAVPPIQEKPHALLSSASRAGG
ncbi:MAG: MraY family glycosyltransferase, partial [Candidatus Acidiferrum sp.]